MSNEAQQINSIELTINELCVALDLSSFEAASELQCKLAVLLVRFFDECFFVDGAFVDNSTEQKDDLKKPSNSQAKSLLSDVCTALRNQSVVYEAFASVASFVAKQVNS